LELIKGRAGEIVMDRLFASAERLMNRLRYPQKMALTAFVIAVPLAVSLYLLVAGINTGVHKAMMETEGVEYNRKIVRFLRDLQQHRGMANAFLRGDRSFGADLQRLEARIEQDASAISNISVAVGVGQRWQALDRKWLALKSSYRKMQADESFNAHTALIAETLSLMTFVADVSNLTVDPDIDSFYLMDTVINKLPLTAEYLGRIRGLGAGALVPKRLSDRERARLIILSGLVSSTMAEVEDNMSRALEANSGVDGELKSYFGKASSAVNAALGILDEEVIFASRITIGPAEYFDALTNAIDMSFRFHAAVTSSLERVLEARLERLKRKRLYIISGAAASIILALYLAVGSYLSIMRGLRSLVGASRRIGEGDLDARVELASKDELAMVAGSFNEMARGLAEKAKKLEGAVADLRRSNEELESFAYVASHDLRSPLMAVASDLKLIERREREREDAEVAGLIADGLKEIGAMEELIADLLAYSRAGSRQGPIEEEADFQESLDRALSNLRVALEESGAEVITETPLPRLKADPVQVTQLFQNLIGNAVKFRREEPPRIHVSATLADGEWVFSVRDNGIGMPEDARQRVFEIFHRLHKDKYPGTGIGLATCKKIVERHGGRIWVESELGAGSTFHFTVPDLKLKASK
jgi:signal transduction histidine kinase